MHLGRIGVLLKKELTHGAKSYFFIYALVAPLVGTLLVHLIFGSITSSKPKLGILDRGSSAIVESLTHLDAINLKAFPSPGELKAAVRYGSRDVGIIFPKHFDTLIKKGGLTTLMVYIWGESLLKNRAMVSSAIMHQIRDFSGKKTLIDINLIPVGEKSNISTKDRYIPAIVLMAIFISGFAIPSTSLVAEKEKRTLGAVVTTPVTQTDIFMAKGAVGIIISMVMGVLILILNQSFNSQLGLTIMLLFLGAIMATCFGLILGAFVKDISSVYSAIQGLGIFIYTPGIVHIFPGIPNWIGKLFPTYYVINPLIKITRGGGDWTTIKTEVFILIAILAILLAILVIVAGKTRQQEG